MATGSINILNNNKIEEDIQDLQTNLSELQTPTFTQASSRSNIDSGESNTTILGKIKKYFTDLKPHAFNSPANNLTTTSSGSYALDAYQGKVLNDNISNMNNWVTLVDWLTESDMVNGAKTVTVNNLTNYNTLVFVLEDTTTHSYWSKQSTIPVTLFRSQSACTIDIAPHDDANYGYALLQYVSDTSVTLRIEKAGWGAVLLRVKVFAQK